MNSIRGRKKKNLITANEETLMERPACHPLASADNPRLLTEKEAARFLGVSMSYLRKSRCEGRRLGRTPPPRFVRVGGRVFYRLADLEQWLSELESFECLLEARDAV
jgi:hypothetical protein